MATSIAPRRLLARGFVLLLLTVLSACSSAPVPIASAPSGEWLTYHHDNARTGFGSSAPLAQAVTPTPGWSSPNLDGQVYAEPLIANARVYTATLNNTVYALSQAGGQVLWHTHLGSPVSTGWSCGNVSPQGILATPVIDLSAGRIYVVALLATTHTYSVFGLSLSTGTVVFTQSLAAVLGSGFDWRIQQQRGALSLSRGILYVPFGGRNGDCGDYHGIIAGMDTSNPTRTFLWQTPGSGSGIWASGGLAIDDSTGSIFAATGNANVSNGCSANPDGTPQSENDATVRLSPTLQEQGSFVPDDWQANWCQNDQDLGSASPLLLSPTLLFQSGKAGQGFLLSPAHLGGMGGQVFPAPPSPSPVCFGRPDNATFGSFASAHGFIYVECEGQGLVALHLDSSALAFTPCATACPTPNWHAGSGLTFGPPIVAGGAVWAASDSNGLYAFNALSGALIYHSDSFPINRFTTPSQAGSQVFVASGSQVLSFSFGPSAASS